MNYLREMKKRLNEMTNEELSEERAYYKFQIVNLKNNDVKLKKYLELVECELSYRITN